MVFRGMTAEDIPAGVLLCRLSGWNQLDADWRVFLRCSSKGCLVAERFGQVVGTVATIRYADRFTWLSMLLVDPQERGKGIGTQLLQHGLAIVGDGQCCRLDATPAGRQIYSRHLFVDEYSLSRMTSAADFRRFPSRSAGTRPMREPDLSEIVSQDFTIFGADRTGLLLDLFTRAPEYARVLEKNGRIEGYMLGRPGFLYSQLGPIVASDEDGARQLLIDCIDAHRGGRFAIDAQRLALPWIAWLKATGFSEERSYVRMYRGENRYPGLPEKQFAVLGPEFG